MFLCIVKAHFYGKNILLNLHEFGFEGQNMKFAVNRLLTCILYCAPGPTTIRTVRKYSRVDRFLSRMTYFVLVSFSSGDAVALLRESYTFIKRHSKVSCSYLIELMLLLLNVLDHLVST